MIQTVSYRTKDGYVCPPVKATRTISDALQLLVEFELGYGGRVADVGPAFIETHTEVLGCKDRLTFKGSEKDMEPLLAVCAASHGLFREAILNDKVGDALIKVTKGKPLLLCNYGPILVGTGVMKGVMSQLLNLSDVEKIKKLKLGDMCAAYAMLHEGTKLETVHEMLLN